MSSRFRVLLRPTLIVSEYGDGKPAIAEEGSIIQLMDMRTMFRNRVSPITQRADELLVAWGKRGKETLGWLAANAVHSMKEIQGPLYYVKSNDKKRLTPWDRIRYDVARVNAKQQNKRRWWLAPWTITFGEKFIPEIRKTIREFGGKVKDSSDHEALIAQFLRIILKTTEIEHMSTKTKGKTTKTGKGANKGTKETKKSAKASEVTKVLTKVTAKTYDPRSRDHDDFVIRRLVKENPRTAGSKKAKIWDKLKKGMSVMEFVEKGGTRGAIRKYLQMGWIKLIPAVADSNGGGD